MSSFDLGTIKVLPVLLLTKVLFFRDSYKLLQFFLPLMRSLWFLSRRGLGCSLQPELFSRECSRFFSSERMEWGWGFTSIRFIVMFSSFSDDFRRTLIDLDFPTHSFLALQHSSAGLNFKTWLRLRSQFLFIRLCTYLFAAVWSSKARALAKPTLPNALNLALIQPPSTTESLWYLTSTTACLSELNLCDVSCPLQNRHPSLITRFSTLSSMLVLIRTEA